MTRILTILFGCVLLAGCAVQKGSTTANTSQVNQPMMAASAAVRASAPPVLNFSISISPSTGVLQSSTDLKTWTVVAQLSNQERVTLPMDSPSAFFRAAITGSSVTLAW